MNILAWPKNAFVKSTAFGAVLMRHKIASSISLIVLLGGGWIMYQKYFLPPAPTKYALVAVARGTVIASITGSGQVSSSNQVVINPKASGTITAVYVSDGQRVTAGQALAAIDSTSAQKAVRDAKANLQSSQLSLQKLQEPADALSLTQAQNTQTNARTDLAKSYQDSYSDITAVYLDLPAIITSFQDMVNGTSATRGLQRNIDYYLNQTELHDQNALTYHDTAIADYNAAQTTYAKWLSDYKLTDQNSATSTIASTLSETYTTVQSLSDSLKSVNTFIRFYSDQMTNRNQPVNSQATSALTNISSYISTVNTHITTLLSDVNTITTGEQNVAQAILSLQKIQAGTGTLDLQSSQLSVTQKQNALQDAEDALTDYTIRAPFSGTLANFDLHVGDAIGSGTAVATEISAGAIADLSLNEVDAAKVSVGQKATLTFDAITDLKLTGHVASISPLGTVSQGVVSYAVRIAFDAQDSRVKSGMTVNAAIIIDTAQNALVVPSSAIKTQGNTTYVLVANNVPTGAAAATLTAGIALPSTPREVPVTVGVSSNTESEITAGLTEGEWVVIRTIAGTAQATTSNAPSLIGGGGGRGGGVLRGG